MSAQVQVSTTHRPGYVKSVIPLESNPSVFTSLLHTLISSNKLEFVDVLSLDDPELLSWVPRPVHALVLVYHRSPAYKARLKEEEAKRPAYGGYGEDEDVIWFRQTIYNACGFYGMLHAVSNGTARRFIEPDSILGQILEKAIPLPPDERVRVLENSSELEKAYTAVARLGDSIPPEHPEDDVNYHFIAFVRSHRTGNLFDMDGGKKGPLDLGPIVREGEDVLGKDAREVIKGYVKRVDGEFPCSLLALVESGN